MFAQVFPLFQDDSRFTTYSSVYPADYTRMDVLNAPASANPQMQGIVAIAALAVNALVFAIIIKRAIVQKKNPYKNEIFTDTEDFKIAMERAE